MDFENVYHGWGADDSSTKLNIENSDSNAKAADEFGPNEAYIEPQGKETRSRSRSRSKDKKLRSIDGNSGFPNKRDQNEGSIASIVP